MIDEYCIPFNVELKQLLYFSLFSCKIQFWEFDENTDSITSISEFENKHLRASSKHILPNATLFIFA